MVAETRLVSLSQLRSHAAWRCTAQGWTQEHVQEVQGLPVTLRSQGLATSLALLMKRGGASRQLANHILQWLSSEWKASPVAGAEDLQGFFKRWFQLSISEAHAVEAEALAFAEALKVMGSVGVT